MDIEQLQIIQPDPAAHGDALFALLNLEWPDIDTVLRAGRISHSHYDWTTAPIELDGDAGQLLPVLFPAQNPQMSNDDL